MIDCSPSGRRRRSEEIAINQVELAQDAELWHAPGSATPTRRLACRKLRAHIAAAICRRDAGDEPGSGDPVAHWPIRSPTFRRWLGRQFFEQHGKAPGSQALQDAMTVLEGQAIFDGPEFPVFVRVAGDDDKLYLDLANETWQAVEIDAAGWRILDAAPVRFRRAKAMMPLPTPTAGGDIGELQRFVNVTPDDWPLLLGWLVAAFRSIGPYPVLALHGEQGAAKSTTARTLRSIIDPNAAPLRCEPREPRDLMIAANEWLDYALDNLLFVPVWLSDALCRLATGGGFATRTLYENDEETIFDSMRPAILTGIEELANRSDLLDRSLILQLPRIPDAKRRTEAEHWREFQQAHGRILGAVLDAVSAAVRSLPTTHIERLPRMADFALWATAAGSGLGLQPGEFLDGLSGQSRIGERSGPGIKPGGQVHLAGGRCRRVARHAWRTAGTCRVDGQRRREAAESMAQETHGPYRGPETACPELPGGRCRNRVWPRRTRPAKAAERGH